VPPDEQLQRGRNPFVNQVFVVLNDMGGYSNSIPHRRRNPFVNQVFVVAQAYDEFARRYHGRNPFVNQVFVVSNMPPTTNTRLTSSRNPFVNQVFVVTSPFPKRIGPTQGVVIPS